jgi:hypothetical protein
MTDFTREQEIEHVEMGAAHVVVLGAGASRAAFPKGEKNGSDVPLMRDFSEIVPIGAVLDPLGISYKGRDFEELYSDLSQDKQFSDVCAQLEAIVYRYFDSLALPDQPTLYDHLILSLRPKDIIATFNWDPFLIQAARRNPNQGGLPCLLFLHGNVRAGYCATDNIHGVKNTRCSECGQPFESSRLLYPTAEKDYDKDPMIRDAWRIMREAFSTAFMVTVFGYSAPRTDAAAVEALKQAWGSSEDRKMEQFEIINVSDEDELKAAWSEFIHTHHFEIHANPYDSWILNHPRRSGEAYINQYQNAYFIDNNPVPRDLDLDRLADWFEPLFHAESRAV